MKVVYGLDIGKVIVDRSVLTIGNFDGVHRGHQQIISIARKYAEKAGIAVAALTFEPHPLSVVNPDSAPRRLTTVKQKLAYLAEAGVDLTVVAESHKELLGLSPDEFIGQAVVGCFKPVQIVEGWNFGFGKGRGGNVETLQDHAEAGGYEVHVVNPVQQELGGGFTKRVSSSLIRQFVIDGKVELAAEALGRVYVMEGDVVAGFRRGRNLGFPTANIDVGEQLVPGDGVYSGVVEVDGQKHRAGVSIGILPTFGDGVRQVEAHLVDFDGDLYGKKIELSVRKRLRGQQSFNSQEELVRQIELDMDQVRREKI